MTWEPTSYILARQDETDKRVADLHGRVGNLESVTASHGRWINSFRNTLRKWPYVVAPTGIVLANIAPVETIKAILEVLKAAL